MDTLTLVVAAGGALLILSSLDYSKLKDWLPKKTIVPDGIKVVDQDGLLDCYTSVRAVLVKRKLDPAKIADFDRVILDEVTGGANDQ